MDNQHLSIGKVIIILGIALCIYLLCPKCQEAYNTYKELENKVVDVNKQKAQIEDLKAQKAQKYQTAKQTTKPIYKNDVEVSDRMSSFGVMFEDVIQSAKYNGLKLRSIEYNESPADDVIQVTLGGLYNVCSIKMQLIGSYMQFRSYFQDIYNYPYVINLDKIIIKPYEKNKKVLIADIVVTLYSEKTDAQKAEYAAAKAAEESADAQDKLTEGAASGVNVEAPQG